MPKRKEIKFQNRYGTLRGRQNGMTFWIHEDKELAATCAPAHYVVIDPSLEDLGTPRVSTGGHQYFHLDGAMEFCQKIAAGEIKLEDLQAAYDAEDDAKERAVFREITEKAKEFQKRLDTKGLKYTDLLELEVLAHSLGDIGHHILLGYEHGEGWPSGT